MTVQSELDRETARIDTLAATLRVVCDLKRADDCGDVMIMLRVEAAKAIKAVRFEIEKRRNTRTIFSKARTLGTVAV